ncbi:MAG: hypothetical protein U0Q11_00050 [Vicinamibacterales bacterium]
MRRTRSRPLPDQRVVRATRSGYLRNGAVSRGPRHLAWATNWWRQPLPWATLVIYLVVYTPTKRTSNLSTLVGVRPAPYPR